MREVVWLVAFVLMACLLVGGTFGLLEPPHASGLDHPTFASMQRSGPAPSQTVLAIGWALGTLQIALYLALVHLALRRREREATPILILVGALWAAAWTALVQAYPEYLTSAAVVDVRVPLVGGLPIPTAWMLYGLGTLPLGLMALYCFGFERFVFGPEEQRRLDEFLARRGDDTPDAP